MTPARRELRPKALDLFCGAGGAAMGLYRAGFDVVGIDNRPQPRYPFPFIQADALKPPVRLADFDLVWASPPCQHYSWACKKARNRGKEYPDLIDPTLEMLRGSGVSYCVENVMGARRRLRELFVLCGLMFGLKVVRHRTFETDFMVMVPPHPACSGAVTRDVVSVVGHGPPGRHYRAVTVAGHGGDSYSFKLSTWKEAMGIDWMTRDELTQSIPPDYSEHIGRYAMIALGRAEA